MHDIKYIRDNADLVREAIANKNEKAEINKVLELDDLRKKTLYEFETLRAEQNKISKEIGQLKKEKKDVSVLMLSMQGVAEKIKDLSTKVNQIEDELNDFLLMIPNIPDSSVPIGKNAEANVVIKTHGQKPIFDFKILEHQDIAVEQGFLDFSRGAKITGSGFPVYIDKGALLERALINFMLDFHIAKHGYTEVKIPFVVNRQAMIGTGQLPKLENDMYHLAKEDFFLIPTSEVPVTNLFAGEILGHEHLPIKYICYSPCFRREAGSYGKDTKGLQRLHQFNKVEMVRFVKPEESFQALEDMLNNAEAILQALELPYRVITLCTGDMSFASAKTYDIEVWSPATEKYLEVSSVSNFIDFQARRANIRFRDTDGKVKFLHTLNGSGLATPRTYIAILENYQQKDGSVLIPKVLQKYMNCL
ncbi:MAG: serine--tRNA ligase [Candidatus Cloacimonetes bacterium]|nr:serine--tRNA ligase [Candidatus Cloacimonadota bacterium]